MDFSTSTDIRHRKKADLLALPFWKNGKTVEQAADFGALQSKVNAPIDAEDFSGKEGEVMVIYVEDQPEQRIALLGLGDQDKLTVEKLRRSYAALAKICKKHKAKEINVLMPKIPALSEEELVRGIADGLLLTNYSFHKLKGEAALQDAPVLMSKATLIGVGKKGIAAAETCSEIADGVYFARDLVNDNADTVTPSHLVHVAQGLAKTLPNIKTTIFDKQRILKEKMGLIYAVGRASPHDPALIIVEYKGNAKSKDLTVLVGKGVTYDTGGLDLKNVGGFGQMDTMKSDMGGAATVLGTVYAAAKLGLKTNVTAIVAAVENAIGPNSFKPGDVYTSYEGKTVEITSTDAEGRLILADALAYASKNLKPTRIIDFATLTGAIEVALGPEITGLFSNDDDLADALMQSSHITAERLWRMPLVEEYRESLKSDVADLKNTAGRPGAAIKAAIFLKEFVGNTPWAHCDIASTAFLPDSLRYHPKHATGIGVRLMIDFLSNV